MRISYIYVVAIPDFAFNGCGDLFVLITDLAHIYRDVIIFGYS